MYSDIYITKYKLHFDYLPIQFSLKSFFSECNYGLGFDSTNRDQLTGIN
jgi:hypothetical protein